MMVDIPTVSIIVASASVVAGVIYYSLQIRHQNKMRQTDLVMKLYSQFNSLEFQKIWEEVLKREAKNYEDYYNKYGLAETTTVGMFFEGIGILLKRKLIDIDLVDDMFTSPIRMTWEKYKDLTLEARKARNSPEALEWFEYLYNEMKKREQRQ
jgi:cytochrome c oxidase assembly factor CtaG